jgi:hypothetical protein
MALFSEQMSLTPKEKYLSEDRNQKNLWVASILEENWSKYNNKFTTAFKCKGAIYHSSYGDDQFDYVVNGVFFKKVFENYIKIFDPHQTQSKYVIQYIKIDN